MDMAGTIRIRPAIFEEYVYDVLKGLARWEIKNVLVINGHGGNAEPARRAAQRFYDKDGLRTMVVEWWNFRRDLSTKIWGGKPHTPGHGALEETALNIAYNPKLIERDLYNKVGPKDLGFQEGGTGFSVFPGIASMGLPQRKAEEGEGLPNFDVEKANEYARTVSCRDGGVVRGRDSALGLHRLTSAVPSEDDPTGDVRYVQGARRV